LLFKAYPDFKNPSVISFGQRQCSGGDAINCVAMPSIKVLDSKEFNAIVTHVRILFWSCPSTWTKPELYGQKNGFFTYVNAFPHFFAQLYCWDNKKIDS